MMMNRRHPKKAPSLSVFLAGHFKITDLNHDRKQLANEDPADNHQRKGLLHHERDHADETAERERTGVAHKYLRGIRIVPKKGRPRSDQRSANHGEFSRTRHMADQEIIGDPYVAG